MAAKRQPPPPGYGMAGKKHSTASRNRENDVQGRREGKKAKERWAEECSAEE
jgi:hypothetical protein